MIKDCEKRVLQSNMEIHAVKWLFFSCDFFCGYSHLQDEADINIVNKFNEMIDKYINEKIPPQYIINKTFFFNYPFYVDEGCFIPRPETEQLVEETIYRIDELFTEDKHLEIADVCCGSGERSEKIRTYNYPQNRVTDHRIGFTIQKLDRVMEGDIQDILDALINEEQKEKLESEM
jgi:hypothetical protein